LRRDGVPRVSEAAGCLCILTPQRSRSSSRRSEGPTGAVSGDSSGRSHRPADLPLCFSIVRHRECGPQAPGTSPSIGELKWSYQFLDPQFGREGSVTRRPGFRRGFRVFALSPSRDDERRRPDSCANTTIQPRQGEGRTLWFISSCPFCPRQGGSSVSTVGVIGHRPRGSRADFEPSLAPGLFAGDPHEPRQSRQTTLLTLTGTSRFGTSRVPRLGSGIAEGPCLREPGQEHATHCRTAPHVSPPW